MMQFNKSRNEEIIALQGQLAQAENTREQPEKEVQSTLQTECNRIHKRLDGLDGKEGASRSSTKQRSRRCRRGFLLQGVLVGEAVAVALLSPPPLTAITPTSRDSHAAPHPESAQVQARTHYQASQSPKTPRLCLPL
ncbi:hypothetical protein V500_00732 [Pseudogymnoascus sp. VKM F-4518 (FW-2643)]|nr:hypothetical protein V500_00732 [Pseudogymnoascus sp. VKM F-4518 (FW-2643)]